MDPYHSSNKCGVCADGRAQAERETMGAREAHRIAIDSSFLRLWLDLSTGEARAQQTARKPMSRGCSFSPGYVPVGYFQRLAWFQDLGVEASGKPA